MLWNPTLSELVVKVALPPTRVAVPRVVAPSFKVTVPVGFVPVTVAVNVTGVPTVLGFCEETSELVEALVTSVTLAITAVVAQLPTQALLTPPTRYALN